MSWRDTVMTQTELYDKLDEVTAERDALASRLSAILEVAEAINGDGNSDAEKLKRLENLARGVERQCSYSVSCAGTFRCTLPEGHDGPHHKVKLTQEWVDRVTRSDAPEPDGCAACGAIAGCCDKYPNCAGNPEWMPESRED